MTENDGTTPRTLTAEESAAYYALLLAAPKRPRLADEPWTGPTIHYTELPPGSPESELFREWETFRRELGRLLAEGHSGRHVLIKGGEVVGVWDDFDTAVAEGRRRFPGQPIAVQLVAEWQPLLRTGYYRTWAA